MRPYCINIITQTLSSCINSGRFLLLFVGNNKFPTNDSAIKSKIAVSMAARKRKVKCYVICGLFNQRRYDAWVILLLLRKTNSNVLLVRRLPHDNAKGKRSTRQRQKHQTGSNMVRPNTVLLATLIVLPFRSIPSNLEAAIFKKSLFPISHKISMI